MHITSLDIRLPIPALINSPLQILARLDLTTDYYTNGLLRLRCFIHEQCSLLLYFFFVFVAVYAALCRRRKSRTAGSKW